MKAGVETVLGPVSTAAALFGTWDVGGPERQYAVAKTIAGAWRRRPWPGIGLRAYTVLAADDGTTMLHFSEVDDLVDVPPQDLTWKQEVDAAVPGIERVGVASGLLRRSTPVHGPAAEATCVVLATRKFDSPDAARADRLVDAVSESGAGVPPADGLLSAHFSVSADGSQVFDCALWVSADAHRRAVENRSAGLETNARWRQAPPWPGLVGTVFQRFRPLLRLTPSHR
ncbi:antibiotic biosynthesis monooxygenase [Streptomyces albus]|uniref:antibiotic biosynthesis monooxygenase n=1 Tax=Streptomyces albus TaxID=1888 RepID=UPI0034515ED1